MCPTVARRGANWTLRLACPTDFAPPHGGSADDFGGGRHSSSSPEAGGWDQAPVFGSPGGVGTDGLGEGVGDGVGLGDGLGLGEG